MIPLMIILEMLRIKMMFGNQNSNHFLLKSSDILHSSAVPCLFCFINLYIRFSLCHMYKKNTELSKEWIHSRNINGTKHHAEEKIIIYFVFQFFFIKITFKSTNHRPNRISNNDLNCLNWAKSQAVITFNPIPKIGGKIEARFVKCPVFYCTYLDDIFVVDL